MPTTSSRRAGGATLWIRVAPQGRHPPESLQLLPRQGLRPYPTNRRRPKPARATTHLVDVPSRNAPAWLTLRTEHQFRLVAPRRLAGVPRRMQLLQDVAGCTFAAKSHRNSGRRHPCILNRWLKLLSASLPIHNPRTSRTRRRVQARPEGFSSLNLSRRWNSTMRLMLEAPPPQLARSPDKTAE